MIQNIINYLEADSTLVGLLGATAPDSKIYPLQAPHDLTRPYILFNISGQGSYEENIKENQIVFDCIADTYLEAKPINDRIDYLLNRQDGIRRALTITDYIYYWAKKTGGADFVDNEMGDFHRVSIIDFKYAASGFEYLLTEDGEWVRTEDGERIIL